MNNLPPFIVKFNEKIKEAEVFLSITRDSSLQRETIDSLKQLQIAVDAEKNIAIEKGNEDYANLLLGCECVTATLIAELKMWLFLKEENPDAAWNELIKAQMAACDAVRAHQGFAHLSNQVKRLDAIEKIIFPPQVFVSSGMIVKNQECSICGSEYGECDHLAGKPYMGRFCYIIARDLSVDHVAIVEQPADKRCRIEHFEDEGGMRNRMTWKIEPKKNA